MSDSEDSTGTETGRIRNLTEKGKKLPSTITRGPKVVRSAIVEKTAEQNNKSHRGFDKFKSLKERKNVSGDKDGKKLHDLLEGNYDAKKEALMKF